MRFILFFCFICPFLVFCQNDFNLHLEDTSSVVKIGYENDLFAGRDKYYTQGIFLGYTIKSEKIKGKSFHFNLIHKVYTPSTIKSENALFHDHPYSAQLVVNGCVSRLNRSKKYVWVLGGFLGYLGPKARGKEMQTQIHRWTNNFLPLGWDYQLKSGLVVDAQWNGIVQLFNKNWFQLFGQHQMTVGTRRMDTGLQLNARLEIKRKRFKCGVSGISGFRIVAYDATLQGVLGAKTSQVVLVPSELKRFVAEDEIELYVQNRNLRISYWHHFQGKRVEQGDVHQWGGIGLRYFF